MSGNQNLYEIIVIYDLKILRDMKVTNVQTPRQDYTHM